jgi:hypothetical protein
LAVGGARVDGHLELPGVAAHLDFIDLKPRRLVAGIGQLRVRALSWQTGRE